jgi:hypothetical protein
MRMRKTMKTIRIIAIPAEIRTDCLPNTSLEQYGYANLIGMKKLKFGALGIYLWGRGNYFIYVKNSDR